MAVTLLSGCAGAPPQITSLAPSNGSRGVPADEPVRVVFDHPVDKTSVAGRFAVDPGLGCDLQKAFVAPFDAPCRVTWSGDGSAFTLLHTGTALFKPDQKYHLHLGPGVRDANGVENSLDHSWELTSGGAPTVRAVSPSDGATSVPVDSPVSITFSLAMAVGPTQRAVHLTPDIPGTRVLVNTVDPSRVVVLPGGLMSSGTRYTITVDPTATDEHGQPLPQRVQSSFTAGGLSEGGHALVLARASGELPSVLLLTRGGPDRPGEPPVSVTLRTASPCRTDACRTRSGPASGYIAGVLSPAGREVAVVEHDMVSGDSPDRLLLIDLPSLDSTVLANGASHPSWSPDGSWLAYGVGDGVDLYSPVTGAHRHLPSGDPLDAAPVWSADGSLLALPVRQPGAAPHVELADPVLQARYAVPGLGPGTSSPALSPAGDRLAVRVDPVSGAPAGTPAAAGTWLVRLRDGSAPQQLSTTLEPVAWADAGTLLGIDRGPEVSTLVRMSIAGGNVAPLSTGPRASDLSTVSADPAGRRIGFLRPDATGRVQAWAMNADGSNPTALTSLTGSDLDAVSVSLGG